MIVARLSALQRGAAGLELGLGDVAAGGGELVEAAGVDLPGAP